MHRHIRRKMRPWGAVSRALDWAGKLMASVYLTGLRFSLILLIVLVFPILCLIALFFLGMYISTFAADEGWIGPAVSIVIGFPLYVFLFFVVFSRPHIAPALKKLVFQISGKEPEVHRDRIVSRKADGSTFEVHSVPVGENPFTFGSNLAEVDRRLRNPVATYQVYSAHGEFWLTCTTKDRWQELSAKHCNSAGTT
jgi:hypothetical protein